jgi:ribonuclease BN (tRNA processing enzyme)
VAAGPALQARDASDPAAQADRRIGCHIQTLSDKVRLRDVVFIGDSGPNQAGQIAVAETLNPERV